MIINKALKIVLKKSFHCFFILLAVEKQVSKVSSVANVTVVKTTPHAQQSLQTSFTNSFNRNDIKPFTRSAI